MSLATHHLRRSGASGGLVSWQLPAASRRTTRRRPTKKRRAPRARLLMTCPPSPSTSPWAGTKRPKATPRRSGQAARGQDHAGLARTDRRHSGRRRAAEDRGNRRPGWTIPSNHETLDFELPLGLAAGASQIQGRRQEPADAGQDRAGPAAVLRPAAVGRRQGQLRQLPQPRRRLCPAHAVRHRHARPEGRPQLAGQLQPHFERPAVLGRPCRVARGSGRGPDRQSDRNGPHARGLRGLFEGNVPGYKMQFDKIFGKLDIEAVGKALGHRSSGRWSPAPSPFDYYERFKPFEKLDPEDLKDDARTVGQVQRGRRTT